MTEQGPQTQDGEVREDPTATMAAKVGAGAIAGAYVPQPRPQEAAAAMQPPAAVLLAQGRAMVQAVYGGFDHMGG